MKPPPMATMMATCPPMQAKGPKLCFIRHLGIRFLFFIFSFTKTTDDYLIVRFWLKKKKDLYLPRSAMAFTSMCDKREDLMNFFEG